MPVQKRVQVADDDDAPFAFDDYTKHEDDDDPAAGDGVAHGEHLLRDGELRGRMETHRSSKNPTSCSRQKNKAPLPPEQGTVSQPNQVVPLPGRAAV